MVQHVFVLVVVVQIGHANSGNPCISFTFGTELITPWWKDSKKATLATSGVVGSEEQKTKNYNSNHNDDD